MSKCIPVEGVCDHAGHVHCPDASDFTPCFVLNKPYKLPPYPVAVDFVNFRVSHAEKYTELVGGRCPDTHFRCPGGGYCLPVYVRCNGVIDCPGREDEERCDSYTCPGYFRCRDSTVCVHPKHLCDKVFQCPRQDDELLCAFNCTLGCICYGHAFFCRDVFPAAEFPELRFLDGGDSGLTPADLVNNTMLVHLSLARCGLKSLSPMSLGNLRILDVSDNQLTEVRGEHIRGLFNLRTLSLASNPLSRLIVGESERYGITTLQLSNLPTFKISEDLFMSFPELQALNLSRSEVDRIPGEGFQSLEQLRVLDLRGCPVTQFPRDVFQGLGDLQAVYADNYKLCCPATLPQGFNVAKCEAPVDEISSCESLLRSQTYRVFLFLFAGFSLIGNVGSFIYRMLINTKRNRGSFGVFVTNLCVADSLMGVYLIIIGVADQMFKGTYLWKDSVWTRSPACSIAGFLSLLSSEVSVFFIGLITLDRFIVIRFPFTSRRFRPRSAVVASVAVWFLGTVLAAVPLLPAASHWNFYSQTGICIPLPITRSRTHFPGQTYSFGVMIVLNFVLFLMIGSGQGLIYRSIFGSRMTVGDTTTTASKDLTVARRLLAVVMSDFLCWFPVGVLGLLASTGVPVPGEVNVAIAIFVLPVNSALNPFLYTLNTLLERRRRLKEQRLHQRLLAEFHDEDAIQK